MEWKEYRIEERKRTKLEENLLKILSNLSFYLKKSEMEMLPKLLFLFDSIRNKKLREEKKKENIS